MSGEIITIGTELISGSTLDINSCYVAERITSAGLQITRITSVGDDLQRVYVILKRAITRSDFVIVTGGLGSTDDDLTSEIAAKAFNRTLHLDKEMRAKIESFIKANKIESTPTLEKMAWIPEGSKLLNPKGMGCGFSLVENNIQLYFLPGVPAQVRSLIDKFVLPKLLSLYQDRPVMKQRILKLYGLNEATIADMFKQLKGRTGKAVFGFYPKFPENHITISLKGEDPGAVNYDLDRVETLIRGIMGTYIFCTGHFTMEDVVGRMLKARNLTIAVAESCTGGLIGHRLTNVSGSSQYFMGGNIVYSNQAKTDYIKVRPETIAKYGAVSDETVREMARGIINSYKTDLALAVTGIAGPDGGTVEKPVGTVNIGLVSKNKIFSDKYYFQGDRKQIKLNASTMALDYVRRYLKGDPFIPGI